MPKSFVDDPAARIRKSYGTERSSIDLHDPLAEIHAGHGAQPHADVVVARADGPDGMGDVVRGQGGGGYLVEQGPESVVVVAVDQGDVDGGRGQAGEDVEPAEPAADDHHTGSNGHTPVVLRRV